MDVRALRAGPLANRSSNLTSDLSVPTTAAAATLTVNEVPLSVSMAFGPTAIGAGGMSTLSYVLSNGAAVGATSVALSDTLPADVTVAGVPAAQTTCTGGTLTAAADGNTIAFTGGALAAGATCTISVDVTSALAGNYRNALESATSSLGAGPPAEATLTVDASGAPGFAKVFSPATIDQAGKRRSSLRSTTRGTSWT